MKTIYNLSLAFLLLAYGIYFLVNFYLKIFDQSNDWGLFFQVAYYATISVLSFSLLAFVGFTTHIIKFGGKNKIVILDFFALLPLVFFWSNELRNNS